VKDPKELITNIIKEEERKIADAMMFDIMEQDDDRVSKWEQQEAQRKFDAFVREQLKEIPPRYQDATFENFEGYPQLVAELKTGKSAILFGKNGTGKTHLAYAMMKHLAVQRVTVRYILAQDLFDTVRMSFSEPIRRADVEALKYVGYLIIDEVDKKFGTQTEFLSLYRIINYRYNWMRPTMLISNSSRDNLQEVILMGWILRLLERVKAPFKISNFRGELE